MQFPSIPTRIALSFFIYKESKAVDVIQDIKNRIVDLEAELENVTEYYIQTQNKEELLKIQSYIQRAETSVFGKFEKNSRNDQNKLVGTEYWIEDDDRRYIGLYRAPYPKYIGLENMDL